LRSSKLLDTGLRRYDDDDVIIVGSVRAYQKDDTCYIGRLVVLPEYQNQGIGKALMREIENQYKNMVKRYALFTGESDPRNRYLYDQLGYKPYKTKKLDDEITMVYLEKSA
jgi:ribosomal protein S18 acetylase RimI-like enzyme